MARPRLRRLRIGRARIHPNPEDIDVQVGRARIEPEPVRDETELYHYGQIDPDAVVEEEPYHFEDDQGQFQQHAPMQIDARRPRGAHVGPADPFAGRNDLGVVTADERRRYDDAMRGGGSPAPAPRPAPAPPMNYGTLTAEERRRMEAARGRR